MNDSRKQPPAQWVVVVKKKQTVAISVKLVVFKVMLKYRPYLKNLEKPRKAQNQSLIGFIP
jgi:hypothetical protein